MTKLPRRLVRITLYLAIWTVLALLSASQSILTYAYAGTGTVDKAAVFKVTLPLWYVWSVLSIGVVAASRRWPIGPGTWRRRLALHFGLAMTFAIVAISLYRASRIALGLPSGRPFGFELMAGLQTHLLTYAMVAVLVHVLTYYRRARDREVRAAELTAELSDARLDALRMQLHPHFLFNTMHAISAAIRDDPEGAENMLAELADLLRTTVDSGATHEVPLRDEMRFIERYVAIQKVRFGERLAVALYIDDDTGDALVPTLILQPLVENAIEHGIAARRRGGRLEIRSAATAGTVVLRVTDDGPGLTDTRHEDGARVGLRNTRARLAHMYGTRARLELDSLPDGGVAATVVLPYHTAEMAAP